MASPISLILSSQCLSAPAPPPRPLQWTRAALFGALPSSLHSKEVINLNYESADVSSLLKTFLITYPTQCNLVSTSFFIFISCLFHSLIYLKKITAFSVCLSPLKNLFYFIFHFLLLLFILTLFGTPPHTHIPFIHYTLRSFYFLFT